ncbi:MAG: hypothetical protein JNJ90_11545 [Saprospiraceae bacterium]|nr:hypothetical protein [Saprospiraceae bacterium]
MRKLQLNFGHFPDTAWVLTDYIIEIARAQGYRKITATFLKTNGAMRRMFEHKRFVIRSGEDGADAAELGL